MAVTRRVAQWGEDRYFLEAAEGKYLLGSPADGKEENEERRVVMRLEGEEDEEEEEEKKKKKRPERD